MRQNPRLAHYRRSSQSGSLPIEGRTDSDDSLDHDRLREQKPSEKCEERAHPLLAQVTRIKRRPHIFHVEHALSLASARLLKTMWVARAHWNANRSLKWPAPAHESATSH